MNWTDIDGTYHSFGTVVFESEYERVINYGTEDKPFRLKFRKILKIGFLK